MKGKYIKTSKGTLAVAYNSDNTPEDIKKNYGRILWYEVDESFNLKLNDKSDIIAGMSKIENVKVIGFVD